MGIPRLTSLVKNEPTLFFKPVKLHNTLLVIDGNCISCWLYRYFCHKSALNGDYNEYEHCVRTFFSVLKRCNIFPVVILDGAIEERKLKIIKERMEERIAKNQKIKTINFEGDSFIPALLTEVFKDTMVDMQVLFCQSFLEADLDITKAAQFFNCPVLSSDSDFYLDDVDYIPFTMLSLDLLELNESEKTSSSKYFISGKLFERQKFLEHFGGLPKLSFLPLLSFLLGNDYSETEIYESFLSNLSGKTNRLNLKQKITVLCKWLQNFNSPEMAVEKFLEQIPSKARQRTKKELLRCLAEKNCDEQSYLVWYLQYSLLLMVRTAVLPVALNNKIKDTEGSSEWLKKAAAFMSLSGADTAKKTSAQARAKLPIPKWILAQYIQGKLPRNLMDLLHSQSFFCAVQMEEHSLQSVSARTYEILQNVLGIIYHDHPKKSNFKITIYSRKGNHLGKHYTTPVFLNPPRTLSEILTLSLFDREKIAFDVLKIEQKHGLEVPDDWKLFFLTVADWYRANNCQIMTQALGCIIFSSIFVGIIDKKFGYHEKENFFWKEFSDNWNKIINERKVRKSSSVTNIPTENFQSAIDKIDQKDCILALKQFISLRDRSISEFFSSKKLFKPILHYFAQLQVNIMTVEILNAILNSPFQRVKIADFYCGTLTYNVYFKIKKYKNLESFIQSEFKQMPTLQTLFLSAVKVIEKLSKCKVLTEHVPQRKTNNRNRQKKQYKTHNSNIQIPSDKKVPHVLSA